MAHAAGLQRARVIVTVISSLVLVWLVLITAIWNGGFSTGGRALQLVSEDPSVTFDKALREFRRSRGRTVSDIIPSVDRAAQLDPIDASPLFFRSFAQILARSEVPLASLEAARRRNPRFGETRLLLLDLYGRNGRPDDAIREAQSLVTLMPQQRTLVVRLIAGLAGREGGEAALARALPTSNVRGPVMLRLAQTGAQQSLLEDLATPMRGLAEDPAQRGWIGSLVTAIASRPDPIGARSLWAIFHDVNAAHIGTTLVDPEFEDGEGDPPFGWSLPGSRAGIAEFRSGALNVFYYGRASATFAQQILTLSPGSYSIISRVTSSEQEMPQGLSWRVICVEDGQPLVNIQLSAFVASASREGEKFAVPSSGCTVQHLQLAATPADIARRQSARIENVLIEQAAR